MTENQADSRLIVTCRYLREDTLPLHNLHLESLAAMGRSDIDKIVRDLQGEVREKLQQQRIINIADGNPRLLKWLLDVVQLEVLGQTGIAGDELLTRLEAVELKFRENILAETLLSGLEDGEKKFLARLSVFRLPVTEDIVRGVAFSQEVAEARDVECLRRLVSLSLVESATVYATQQPEYRVTTILEPLLQDGLTVEEWQSTKKAATASIYKTWWEDTGDTYNEEQTREIVRLAVAAESKEIAVTIGDLIANRWVNGSRYVEVLEICREILQLGSDYRILGTIARAEETLGLVAEAMEHYQTALELCPEDELIRKAVIIHNIALLKAQQGEIEDAIALYNQSLQIYESINDVGGKAATLNNMAYLAGKIGDTARELELYLQVADILGKTRDYINLHTVLYNLGVTDESQRIIYFAQAVWLCLRVQIPLIDTVETFKSMYNRVPQGDEMEALLGAAACYLCQVRGGNHPQLEELQERSFNILLGAAGAQGIETQDAFDTSFEQQQLNNPEYYIPRLAEKLAEIVGDEWLFERF